MLVFYFYKYKRDTKCPRCKNLLEVDKFRGTLVLTYTFRGTLVLTDTFRDTLVLTDTFRGTLVLTDTFCGLN